MDPSSAGRAMQMIGSFAEFERSLIRERTRADLQAAREQDVMGRTEKPKKRP